MLFIGHLRVVTACGICKMWLFRLETRQGWAIYIQACSLECNEAADLLAKHGVQLNVMALGKMIAIIISLYLPSSFEGNHFV